MSSERVMLSPAWNEVYGFEGVAADVRDVKTVNDEARMDVSCVVVDCDDGTADASAVRWESIFSIDFVFPEPAIPLPLEFPRKGSDTSRQQLDLLPCVGH